MTKAEQFYHSCAQRVALSAQVFHTGAFAHFRTKGRVVTLCDQKADSADFGELRRTAAAIGRSGFLSRSYLEA